MALLDVSDLHVRFPTEDGVVHAARGVSLSVGAGEVLAVVGESGSGKSVTAMAIMGLLPRSSEVTGSVDFSGVNVLGLTWRERTRYRGSVFGMIFQDPMSSLNPVYRVGWQLAEAVRLHQRVGRRAANRRAVELLRIVGIPHAHERARSYPHEFSGGMRQRVMLAMAIANEPQILIADEPTTALDVTVQAQVLETITAIQAETDLAIILITHDLGVVAGMADHVAVMYAGAVVESGRVDEIFYSPRMPYTLGLLGAIPQISSKGRRLNQIPGTMPSLIDLPPRCAFVRRCPLAVSQCHDSAPPLAATDRRDHRAACHRSTDLAAMDTSDLFRPEPPEPFEQ